MSNTTLASTEAAVVVKRNSFFLSACKRLGTTIYNVVPLTFFYVLALITTMYSVPSRHGTILPQTFAGMVSAYCLLAVLIFMLLLEIRHVCKMKALETGAAARKLMYIGFGYGGLVLVSVTATIFAMKIGMTVAIPVLWIFATVEFALAAVGVIFAGWVANVASNNIMTRQTEIGMSGSHHND